MDRTYLDNFIRAYVECALWASLDDSDTPLDANYGPEDLAPVARAMVLHDCAKFVRENREDLDEALYGYSHDAETSGYDFWLTRNGHGAGFWDRGLGELGDILTARAEGFGPSYLYVGDDGQLYVD